MACVLLKFFGVLGLLFLFGQNVRAQKLEIRGGAGLGLPINTTDYRFNLAFNAPVVVGIGIGKKKRVCLGALLGYYTYTSRVVGNTPFRSQAFPILLHIEYTVFQKKFSPFIGFSIGPGFYKRQALAPRVYYYDNYYYNYNQVSPTLRVGAGVKYAFSEQWGVFYENAVFTGGSNYGGTLDIILGSWVRLF